MPMTLTIDFSPQEEAWLQTQAMQQGLAPEEIIKKLVEDLLPEHEAPVIDAENAAAIALLNFWLEEEGTDDPEEIRQAEQELAELKHNLNANPAATGEGHVFP